MDSAPAISLADAVLANALIVLNASIITDREDFKLAIMMIEDALPRANGEHSYVGPMTKIGEALLALDFDCFSKDARLRHDISCAVRSFSKWRAALAHQTLQNQ